MAASKSSSSGNIIFDVRVIESGKREMGGRRGHIMVSPQTDVRGLKEKVVRRFGVPVEEQTILFRGGILKDDVTIQDCGVLPNGKETANLVVVHTRRSNGAENSGAKVASGDLDVLGADVKKGAFRWDPGRLGSEYKLSPEGKKAWFSHNSWQTIEGDRVFPPNTGCYYWEITFSRLSVKKNTFAAVFGVVPDAPYVSKVNQPIGWQKVAGWGLVLGTGQRLHKGQPKDYTTPGFERNDRVGVLLDTNNGTLTFFRNGRSLGEAFNGLTMGVRPALSCIQSQVSTLTTQGAKAEADEPGELGQDPLFRLGLGAEDSLGEARPNKNQDIKGDSIFRWSPSMRSGVKLDRAGRRVVCSLGGWVTLMADRVLSPGSGVFTWELLLNKVDTEKNVFGCVVGVVPAENPHGSSNQPIGWKKIDGWGLVIGTGELLHRSVGRQYPGVEGKVDLRSGDRVGVLLDTDQGILRYYRNGRDIGVAFRGIRERVRPALSCIQSQEISLITPASFTPSTNGSAKRIGVNESPKLLDNKEIQTPSEHSGNRTRPEHSGNRIRSSRRTGRASQVDGRPGFLWATSGTLGDPIVTGEGRETRGCSASWKTVLGDTVFYPRTGKYEWEITLCRLQLRSNTFGVVLGVVPANFAAKGSGANQPVGWKTVPGWSLVTGTGQKLHQSGALPYSEAASFRQGERVGVRLDTDAGTLEFFRDRASLGIAFTGICVAVRAALSCIQSQSTILDSPPPRPLSQPSEYNVSSGPSSVPPQKHRLSPSPYQREGSWRWELAATGRAENNGERGKRTVSVVGRAGKKVSTTLSSWHTVLGGKVLEPNTGVHSWQIKLEQLRLDNNTFGVVVGVVPQYFHPDPSTNQPIGWKSVPGWSLVAGTGAKLHQSSSMSYLSEKSGRRDENGSPAFREGDVIGVRLDTDHHTLEFLRNGRPLGVAFKGIRTPVRPALSSIGTQVTLLLPPSRPNGERDGKAEEIASNDANRGQINASKKMRTDPAASSSDVERGVDLNDRSHFHKIDLEKSSDNKNSFRKKDDPSAVEEVPPLTRIVSSGTSWQTTVGSSAMSNVSLNEGSPGIFMWEVHLRSLSTSKNTFAVVVGVVSADFEISPRVNQPVGWRSAKGWALVAGSGMKLHDSKSTEYATPFESSSCIGVRFNTFDGSLEFLRDGESLGVAFKGISVPVYPAISCIQTQEVVASRVSFFAFQNGMELKMNPRVTYSGWGNFSWEKRLRSPELRDVNEGELASVGASWQTAIGDRIFRENTGIHIWGVKLKKLDLTKNSFGAVIGLVPADFRTFHVNQPVGWSGLPGWTLIASEGKLLRAGVKKSYAGNKAFRKGDVVGLRLDTHRGTLHFYRNSSCLGLAFSNLDFPLRACISIVHKQWVQLCCPHTLPPPVEIQASDKGMDDSMPSASEVDRKMKKKEMLMPMLIQPKVLEGKDNRIASENKKDVVDQFGVEDEEELEGMKEVRVLLESLGLMEYYEKFCTEHVTYDTLKILSLDDLREIVPKFGHRAKIRNRMKEILASEQNQKEKRKENSSSPSKLQQDRHQNPNQSSGQNSFPRELSMDDKGPVDNAGSRRGMGLEIYRRVLSTVVSGVYVNPGQVDQLDQIQSEYGLTEADVSAVMKEVGTSAEEIKSKLERSRAIDAGIAGGANSIGNDDKKQREGSQQSIPGGSPNAAGGMDAMEEEEDEPPDAYLCPITTDIMSDPVVAEDGKTYERSAIESWFKNSDISPITGQRIQNRSLLISNQNLKKLILQWKEKQERSRKARS
mmetsp:Transcript_10039/g.24723  ORF Transcript_10039/g.24723 Transcript_10039/m.24723 type:complete len:1765 (+) Transcript_10039:226-5520(+)